LNLLSYLPLKDILNLRLTSKSMYDNVTSFSKELQVWKININQFADKPPPDFFFSSHNDLKLTFPPKVLKPFQQDELEKFADRIIGIDVHSYNRFRFTRDSWLKLISGLQSLTVREKEYYWDGEYKHLTFLLFQHRESIQELLLENIYPANILLNFNFQFEKLTKLHIDCDPDKDWSTVVPFINKCPNLVDLKLHGIADLSSDYTVHPHPKLKYLDLYKKYRMGDRQKVAAYVRDILVASQQSLEYLKLRAYFSELNLLWELDWYVPKVRTLDIMTTNDPVMKEHLRRHFCEDVKVI